jgi:hypothetical protein
MGFKNPWALEILINLALASEVVPKSRFQEGKTSSLAHTFGFMD